MSSPVMRPGGGAMDPFKRSTVSQRWLPSCIHSGLLIFSMSWFQPVAPDVRRLKLSLVMTQVEKVSSGLRFIKPDSTRDFFLSTSATTRLAPSALRAVLTQVWGDMWLWIYQEEFRLIVNKKIKKKSRFETAVQHYALSEFYMRSFFPTSSQEKMRFASSSEVRILAAIHLCVNMEKMLLAKLGKLMYVSWHSCFCSALHWSTPLLHQEENMFH